MRRFGRALALGVLCAGSAEAGAQAVDNPRLTIESLPDVEGFSPWDYLGAVDLRARVEEELRRQWFDHEGAPSGLASYSAVPSFDGARRAVFFNFRYGPGRDERVVQAHRVSFRRDAVARAVEATLPLDVLVREFRRSGGRPDDPEWATQRERLLPDARFVARLVPLAYDIADERTCHALRAALERLANIDPPPIRTALAPIARDETFLLVGDGTSYRLAVDVLLRATEDGITVTRSESLTLHGGSGSVAARWVDAFERDTADCWRPDDGSEPPSP